MNIQVAPMILMAMSILVGDFGDNYRVNQRAQETALDMESEEIEDYDADSGVEGYLIDHDADGDYRELKADCDRDVYENFAKTNLTRQTQGKRELTLGDCRQYWNIMMDKAI